MICFREHTMEEVLPGLMAADWENNAGAIRFRQDIPLAELSGARLFTNARMFLSATENLGGVAATQTGNLQRAVVAEMVRILEWPNAYMEEIRSCFKVANELDAWPLHVIRIICEHAGLLHRRRARFSVAKNGRGLLADEKAGELYRRLFIGCFRHTNLDYFCRFVEDFDDIQRTFAIILWRLADFAADWVSAEKLIPRILLPAVMNDIEDRCITRDNISYIVTCHVYMPLHWFGLIEHDSGDTEHVFWKKCRIRKSPLFDRFIKFIF